jgi:hypothetical protein
VADAEAIFAKNDEVEISKALVRLAYHHDDWKWMQSKCLHYIESGSEALQFTAIICLGHVARIHHQLDVDLVLPILTRLQENPKLEGRVQDALDDIDTYITRRYR